MVKIRLQRLGNKGRPFYRVVVSRSTAGRNGAFVEIVGTYDPSKPEKPLILKNERAMHWLQVGAVPTETAARLLKRAGVLEEFLAAQPSHKAKYKFLDKRVAVTASTTVIEAPAAAEETVEAPAPVVDEAPVEAPAEPAAEATESAPEAEA